MEYIYSIRFPQTASKLQPWFSPAQLFLGILVEALGLKAVLVLVARAVAVEIAAELDVAGFAADAHALVCASAGLLLVRLES